MPECWGCGGWGVRATNNTVTDPNYHTCPECHGLGWALWYPKEWTLDGWEDQEAQQ